MLKFINFLFGIKDKEVNLNVPYGLVEFTQEAKRANVLDEYNKIIRVWERNKYGFVGEKVYKYNPALINILERRGIPILDITKKKQTFLVITKRDPGMVNYTK